MNDSSLPRPPLGYYYAIYVVKRDSVNKPIDTIFVGPIGSPYPRRSVSLKHADSVNVDPIVQMPQVGTLLAGNWANAAPGSIVAASNRITMDSVPDIKDAAGNPFRGFAQVYLTMESKNATEGRMGPALHFIANVPEVVRAGKK